jgi:PAS domain S-box-containing protein
MSTDTLQWLRSLTEILPRRADDTSATGDARPLAALIADLEFAAQLRTIVDHVPVGLFVNDAEGRCVWVNATYSRMLGRAVEGLLGDGWRDALLPDSADLPIRAAATLAQSGHFGPVPVSFRAADGSVRTASTRMARLHTTDGRLAGVVGVVADITDVRAQQDALARSEAQFRALLGALEEGVVLQDASGQTVLWNAAAERILGLTAEQLRGVTSTDPRWQTLDAEGRPLPGDQHPAMVTLRSGKPVSGFLMGVARPAQAHIWIRVSAMPVTLPGPTELPGVVTTFVDITESREAEEQLRRSERQLRQVTDSAREAIGLHEADGRYVWLNDAARDVLGWEPHELLGKDPYAFFHPDDIDRIRRESHEAVLAGKSDQSITFRFRRADGRYTWLETTTALVATTDGSPPRLLTSSRGVDARMAADVRNARRQRLGGVTHFAGRLAHDFTNLYTVLHARLDLMRERLEGDVREDLDAAFEAVERATMLVRDLRALGGREAITLAPLRLESLVPSLLGTLQSRTSAQLVWTPPPAALSLPVLVDPAVLELTLASLVRNAEEVHPGRATVTVSVAMRHLDTPLIEPHGELPVGEWAVIRCHDDGPGVSDAVLERIFEPEFSAKGDQVETGLGVPVALARMQRMLGHLSIARAEAGGTLVSLWLPITRVTVREGADSPEGHAIAVEQSVEREAEVARSTGTARPRASARVPVAASRPHVLLVDDDVLVLRTAQRLLERAGFPVTVASSGHEAEQVLDRSPDDIALVVSDVVMPGLSGPELMARRRAVGDRRPVVYMSGYTSDALPPTHGREPSAPLVAKPFTSATLVEAIERALEGAAAH